jgi:hypothetical protein
MTRTLTSHTVGIGTFLRCWRVMRITKADLPSMTSTISDGIVRSIESGAAFVAPQAAVAPKRDDLGGDPTAVADNVAAELGLQTWRLQRRVQSLDPEKHAKESRQLMDSCRRFERLLESMQVEVADPSGREYVDGWAEIEVVGWEPAGPGMQHSRPVIKQTISPIIRRAGKIIKIGQVIVVEPSA